MIPAAKEVLNFLSNLSNVSAETENKCCQLKALSSTCSESILSTEEDYESEESLCDIDFEELDRVSNGYFDLMSQGETETIDLDMLTQMSSSDEFHKMPDDFE